MYSRSALVSSQMCLFTALVSRHLEKLFRLVDTCRTDECIQGIDSFHLDVLEDGLLENSLRP